MIAAALDLPDMSPGVPLGVPCHLCGRLRISRQPGTCPPGACREPEPRAEPWSPRLCASHDRVLAVLRAGHSEVSAIAPRARLKEVSVRSCLYQLRHHGRVERCGRGVWRIL